MTINENLLNATLEREVPHSDLLVLTEPIEDLEGEERTNMQNKIAEEIRRKYPLRKKTDAN